MVSNGQWWQCHKQPASYCTFENRVRLLLNMCVCTHCTVAQSWDVIQLYHWPIAFLWWLCMYIWCTAVSHCPSPDHWQPILHAIFPNFTWRSTGKWWPIKCMEDYKEEHKAKQVCKSSVRYNDYTCYWFLLVLPDNWQIHLASSAIFANPGENVTELY